MPPSFEWRWRDGAPRAGDHPMRAQRSTGPDFPPKVILVGDDAATCSVGKSANPGANRAQLTGRIVGKMWAANSYSTTRARERSRATGFTNALDARSEGGMQTPTGHWDLRLSNPRLSGWLGKESVKFGGELPLQVANLRTPDNIVVELERVGSQVVEFSPSVCILHV